MARVPQVTRTIKTTEAKVMCLNVETGTACELTFTLTRTYKDNDAVIREVAKKLNNTEVKAVHVISTDVKETRYGMTEDEFVQVAKELPALNTATEE